MDNMEEKDNDKRVLELSKVILEYLERKDIDPFVGLPISIPAKTIKELFPKGYFQNDADFDNVLCDFLEKGSFVPDADNPNGLVYIAPFADTKITFSTTPKLRSYVWGRLQAPIEKIDLVVGKDFDYFYDAFANKKKIKSKKK
jgi:hypothetical protein